MSTAPHGSPEGSSAFSTLAGRVRERVLLTGALREVASRPAARHELVRAYYDAAVDRIAVADRLTDERGVVAALLLYREALPLLVTAIAVAHDPDVPATAEPLSPGASPWDVLADLHQRGRLPALPAKLDLARAALVAGDALAFDRLPPRLLLERRATVETTVRHLRRLVEPRTRCELKGNRYARLAGLAGLLALLVAGVVSILMHPNLALKKPVTASSRHPASIAPIDNSGLTNGVIEPTYGIHTAPGPGWVLIDLQEIRSVSQVKIFNRQDALFDAGLPLFLETSADGVTFAIAETHTQPFSTSNPWTYKAPAGAAFRFLRIRSNTMVALTEVEVY